MGVGHQTSGDDVLYVDSPAVGTGLQPLPCGDDLRPEPPPDSRDPLAVTLSGGGFRATLAGLGALRLMADIESLGDLRYLSSVSGGSITNAVTALAWPRLRDRGFTTAAFDELVVDPVVAQLSSRSLKFALLRGLWRTVGPATRTDVLARRLDEWFLHEAELEHLDPGVRWIISAANMMSGVRFGFERDVVGDYTIGLLPTKGTGLRLSRAVAASAAVPGTFAPVRLGDLQFPCGTVPPALLDGGVYDNTGLEALDGERYRDVFLFTLNAGGLLRAGPYGKVPLVRDLARANSLLYRQSTTLRTRDMVNRFRRGRELPPGSRLPDGAHRGVLVSLATDMPTERPEPLRAWYAAHPEHRTYDGRDLARVPTVFDKLDERLCRALVYRGWWLMGAALAAYHPERLPSSGISPPPL
ncbi:patatin-like phospholipase family protein [Modestobacter excelsi]|uniref:patatin-like phospholipase family protein n=1 Tax=Modestobacter excelsi TaxID=2213161 RepID=UPI00110D0D79|nr:patatin-like phospholipase family protein [Modestobacter excelsi]